MDSEIFGEHGDDDFPVLADIGNRRRYASAGWRELCRRLRHDVINSEIMAAAENAARHPFTHPAQTDEADLHHLLLHFGGHRPPPQIYSRPLARACSWAATDQSFSPL